MRCRPRTPRVTAASDGLPQDEMAARGARNGHDACASIRWHWSDQCQRDDGEGQRGHAVSLPQETPELPAGGGIRCLFEFVQRTTQGFIPVGARHVRRNDQRGLSAAGVGGLVEGVDHETRHQFVAAVVGAYDVHDRRGAAPPSSSWRAVAARLAIVVSQVTAGGVQRPRELGALFGVRARTKGGPPAPGSLDASSFQPCSVHSPEQ